MSTEPGEPVGIPDGQRQQALATAVQQEVTRGGRVESQGPYNAIIRYGKDINHVLHLILTLVTCSVWGLVWLALVINQMVQKKAVSLQVDPFGNVLRQEM